MRIDIVGLHIKPTIRICSHKRRGDVVSYRPVMIDKRVKAIKQLDIDTGEVIAEYSSVTLAAKANLVHKTSISRALKHNNGILRNIGIRFAVMERRNHMREDVEKSLLKQLELIEQASQKADAYELEKLTSAMIMIAGVLDQKLEY